MFGNGCASNKKLILMNLEEEGHRLQQQLAGVTEQAILKGWHAAWHPIELKLREQFATYLQMAVQTQVDEYAKEGSEVLLIVIDQWSRDTTGRLQTWLAEKG